MSDLSFASARSTTLSTVSDLVAPFNDALHFNKIIGQQQGKAHSIIHSINPNQILRAISRDEIESLQQITLGCASSNNGPAMWDTLFNQIGHGGFTACVFLADSQYGILDRSRVIVASQFLNFSMAVSRIHLNAIKTGDKIGIGIFDVSSRLSYVLLYDVDSSCMVAPLGAVNDLDDDSTVKLIPAANCQLEQVYRVDATGSAEVIDTEDKTYGNTLPFVEHIVSSITDITHAFPWKPHFLPQAMSNLDRETIEARLLPAIADERLNDYGDFEDACRELYDSVRPVRRKPVPRRDGSGAPKKPPLPKNPLIEVISLGDGGDIIANVLNGQGETNSFRFARSDMGSAANIEGYLMNRDFEGRELVDIPGIMVLSEESFGRGSTVRYLSVSF